MPLITIPARRGIATPLKAGQTIKIINTHGTQVVDTWAFTLASPLVLSSPISQSSATPSILLTQLSMPHTRACLCRTIPKVGDGLYDNKRAKILEVTEDTTSGVHDTLIAACDEERYLELMGEEGRGHRNCADNLVEALGSLDRMTTNAAEIPAPQFTPAPLNLFMNIPIDADRTSLSFERPTSGKGEWVCLRAVVDVVVAFSACPQDVLTINCGNPVDAHFEIS